MVQVRDRIVKTLDRAVDIVIVLICLIILFISIYSILDNLWQVHGAMPNATWDHSTFISDKQVAWLCIDKTNIDYPVMQGEDNYEYLNKDPYGEFKMSGSIFLDYRNDSNFMDDYSVIYGHHMERGTLFGALDDFKDEDYFDEHRTGKIITRKTTYYYELFAVAEGDAGNQLLFNPLGRQASEIREYLAGNALIYEKPAEDRRIVVMSTCSGDNSMTRLLVFGTIKEQKKAS